MTGTGSRAEVALASLLFVLGFALLADSPARAAEINSFTASVSTTQAGGHPDIETYANFDTSQYEGLDHKLVLPPPGDCFCGDPRTINQHFPTGLIGNPHAVPKCSLAEFATNDCAPEAQVGLAFIGIAFGPPGSFLAAPLYNMEPHTDEAGLTGFTAPIIRAPQFLALSARTGGDFGLDARGTPIYRPTPVLLELGIVLWGVPADSSNDDFRLPRHTESTCYPIPCKAPLASDEPLIPYLQNPTRCGVPLSMSIDMEYYDYTTDHAEAPWPETTGCDQLSFDPSLIAKPTTTQADTASGLDVDLTVPQTMSATVPSPSEIRGATVRLPEGFSINPNAADGKTSCTDTEASFETEAAAQCPEHAKLGTLQIDSSALPGPIDGAVYLGAPKPSERYRLILVADGFGTHVKLPGSVHVNPDTGQLIISFKDLPQTPFSEFDMHLFGSERGLLATPARCGTYEVISEFEPWAQELSNQTSTSFSTVDSGPNGTPCPKGARDFSPEFRAGTQDNTAAVNTPFALELDHDDGDQNLAALNVKTPPGFTATLKGIRYCSDAALATAANVAAYSGRNELTSSSCPPQSQIGTSSAAAGAGSRPIHLPGKVYLAGPYKRAPLSLAVITPAVSGPYDLGNVVIRAAIEVDPVTTQITTVSDPLPQIFEGIPLRLRAVQVNLDRPGFTRNPTNCDPFSIDAVVFGDEGARAALNRHFQVANCSGLPFSPRLSLKLTGGLGRRGHPAIHAALSAKPGEANIRTVSVTLPEGELLDNSHLGAVCKRVDFARDTCPASSLIGRAEATSPLLDLPLSGSVYLRSSPHDLPDMALDLEGQFDIEAVGRIDSVKGRLRTTFNAVPDVPIGTIALDLAGGRKGLIQNSEGLCGVAKRATVRMIGQNGRKVQGSLRIRAACGEARRKLSSGRIALAGRGER